MINIIYVYITYYFCGSNRKIIPIENNDNLKLCSICKTYCDSDVCEYCDDEYCEWKSVIL